MSVTLSCTPSNFDDASGVSTTQLESSMSIDNAQPYYSYSSSTTFITSSDGDAQVLCTLSTPTTLEGFQWINEGTHESAGLKMYLDPASDDINSQTSSHDFSDEGSILRTWLNGSFTSASVTKIALGKESATVPEQWTIYGIDFLSTAASDAPTYMWFDVWTLADEPSTENTKIYMPEVGNICNNDEGVFDTTGRTALLPVEIEADGDYNYVKHTQCITPTPEDKYYMVQTSTNTEIFDAIWAAADTASYEKFDLASTSVTYTDSSSGSWDVYEVQSTDNDYNQVNFWYLANQKEMTYVNVMGQISGNDVSSNVLLGCFDYDSIFEGGHYWQWVLDTTNFSTNLDVNTWAVCKDIAGAADQYVVFTGGAGDHQPGCFSFSDSDSLAWKTDLNQVPDSLCVDTEYASAYSHVYLSSYQSEFDYPVYQGTFVNANSNIVGWTEDSLESDLDSVFQIVEGRGEKDVDADCVTISSRDGGAVSLDFNFKTDYELTTVQYNIPTEGTTISAWGANSNNYECATSIQQGSVANWGLADCTGAEYSTFSALTFANSMGSFQICGLIVNHINYASSWNYWFVNPWSYEDQQSINLGSDPCVNEDSIFDGSGYVEYSLGGSDGAVTISHDMCGDGTADLRFALGSTEQFTTATFETDALDDAAQDNLFDITEVYTGLYLFSQANYADYDLDGLTRNYNWVFYFGLGPLDAETQESLVYPDDIVFQGCYEHNTDVFTEVILFGENTWSGYTEADCTAAAQLMLFDYAVITGNGLTEEGCYGVMEADVALLEALTRADNANCHDWCDSNRVGMCGGRDFADVYSLFSLPSFEDAGYSEPVVTPEESSSEDDWVYPDDPLEPVFPDAPEMATPPSESSSEDEEVAAGARIAIAAATAISALAISA